MLVLYTIKNQCCLFKFCFYTYIQLKVNKEYAESTNDTCFFFILNIRIKTKNSVSNKYLKIQYFLIFLIYLHFCFSPFLKVCGRGFSSITNLGRHMMIHTGEKRFKCEECDRSFIQKVDYEAHMRRKHTGERPYECKICEKSFYEFSVLHRHKKTRTHKLAVQFASE